MKIRFNREARIDDKVAFDKDTTHDLSETSAMRWVRRGIASIVEPSKIEEVANRATGKLKEVVSNVVGKVDAVVNKEPEFENSEGAAASQDTTQIATPNMEPSSAQVAAGQEDHKKDVKDAATQEAVAKNASEVENERAKSKPANKSVKGL